MMGFLQFFISFCLILPKLNAGEVIYDELVSSQTSIPPFNSGNFIKFIPMADDSHIIVNSKTDKIGASLKNHVQSLKLTEEINKIEVIGQGYLQIKKMSAHQIKYDCLNGYGYVFQGKCSCLEGFIGQFCSIKVTTIDNAFMKLQNVSSSMLEFSSKIQAEHLDFDAAQSNLMSSKQIHYIQCKQSNLAMCTQVSNEKRIDLRKGRYILFPEENKFKQDGFRFIHHSSKTFTVLQAKEMHFNRQSLTILMVILLGLIVFFVYKVWRKSKMNQK